MQLSYQWVRVEIRKFQLSNYIYPVIAERIGQIAMVIAQSPTQGVGPDYRPEEQKPTATVSTEISYDNVHILPQTPQLIALLT